MLAQQNSCELMVPQGHGLPLGWAIAVFYRVFIQNMFVRWDCLFGYQYLAKKTQMVLMASFLKGLYTLHVWVMLMWCDFCVIEFSLEKNFRSFLVFDPFGLQNQTWRKEGIPLDWQFIVLKWNTQRTFQIKSSDSDDYGVLADRFWPNKTGKYFEFKNL